VGNTPFLALLLAVYWAQAGGNMADPATMMMAGAALGAVANQDDPLKGAMMGAALGGVGGGIASGALGGAGAAGVEGAAMLGAESLAVPAAGSAAPIFVTPATMAEFMPMAQSAAPVAQAFPVGAEAFASPTFDFDAIARASLGSDLPGASAVAGASPVQAGFNPMRALSAMNMLGGQQQPQPIVSGGVKRGDPRLVQQDPIMSLLAPKRVEKRRISLL
jgi:hypothetical protein